jgi:inorganic pyrophosphatase/exopolyphosphatase
MFNPNEWTRKIQFILEAPQITYINNHTGLPKLKQTFTRDQQEALEQVHCKKVYDVTDKNETERSENDTSPSSG